MAETTNISWCDHTFNHVVGCSKISPACDNCFAESWAKRAGSPELWQGERRRTTEANWRQPLKWDAAAKAAGVRRRVFCASLSDVFDNEHDPMWRSDLFRLIRQTPNLDWLLLTKRIGNAASMIERALIDGHLLTSGSPQWPWPHVWLGATIANQAEADRDIPKLLATPARVRFLSCEPLLGAVDLRQWIGQADRQAICASTYTAVGEQFDRCDITGLPCDTIDWVIAGGESGGKARPSHPDWFRSLRDQCAAAGVAFHFKQWGEWWPISQMPHGVSDGYYDPKYGNGKRESDRYEAVPPKRRAVTTTVLQLDGTQEFAFPPGAMTCFKVGKKAAGRTLDGVVHDSFPEVTR